MLAGDEAGARAALERAVDLDPGDLEARANLAVLEARRGDIEAARTLVERMLRIDPDYRPAVSLRERLEIEAGASGERALGAAAPEGVGGQAGEEHPDAEE